MSKFLLMLGPSGAGKSTIIAELEKLDSRFIYISPYMTRPLRAGERNKTSISHDEMDSLQQGGELLTHIVLHGDIRYGTPWRPIVEALAQGNFPMLDWPIDRLAEITKFFTGQTYTVYVAPPTLDVLRQRLAKDGRDPDGRRLAGATAEILRYWDLGYVGRYHLAVVSEDNRAAETAAIVYAGYLQSF